MQKWVFHIFKLPIIITKLSKCFLLEAMKTNKPRKVEHGNHQNVWQSCLSLHQTLTTLSHWKDLESCFDLHIFQPRRSHDPWRFQNPGYLTNRVDTPAHSSSVRIRSIRSTSIWESQVGMIEDYWMNLPLACWYRHSHLKYWVIEIDYITMIIRRMVYGKSIILNQSSI